MPVVYRTVQNIDAKPNIQLFGHPTILYLSNNTTGEILYDTVDRVVPCFANYSVVLTDGQVGSNLPFSIVSNSTKNDLVHDCGNGCSVAAVEDFCFVCCLSDFKPAFANFITSHCILTGTSLLKVYVHGSLYWL